MKNELQNLMNRIICPAFFINFSNNQQCLQILISRITDFKTSCRELNARGAVYTTRGWLETERRHITTVQPRVISIPGTRELRTESTCVCIYVMLRFYAPLFIGSHGPLYSD